MLMYLFMYQFTQSNFNKQKISKTLIPLALSGLFFGIGAATEMAVHLCRGRAGGDFLHDPL